MLRELRQLTDPRIVDEVLSSAAKRRVAVCIKCASDSIRGILADVDTVAELDQAVVDAAGWQTLLFEVHGVPFILRAWLIEQTARRELRIEPARRELYTPLDRRRSTRVSWSGAARIEWAQAGRDTARTMIAPVVEFTPDGVTLARASGSDWPRGGTTRRVGLELVGLEMRGHADLYARKERAGVELRSPGDREALIDAYLRRRFPRFHARRDAELAAIRHVMVASGYTALRDGGPLSSEWASADSRGVSLDVVYRAEDRRPIGHISLTRAYRRTWLAHQLATIAGHTETTACRNAIYTLGSVVPRLHDGDEAMFLAYFDRSKRWHQLFFEEFTHWSPDLSAVGALDRFERVEDAPASHVLAPPNCSVEWLEERHMDDATALIRGQLPRLVADAMDVEPTRLSAAYLHPSYRTTSFVRGRVALALLIEGTLAGVALCERGSRALSLFGIFDMAQVYFDRQRVIPPAAQLAFLSRVRSFYAVSQVRNPLVVAPSGTLMATHEPGTRLVETMGVIAIDARGLRQFEGYVAFQFGRRWSRHLGAP